MNKAHDKSVQVLIAQSNYILSGGSDGRICVYEKSYVQLFKVQLEDKGPEIDIRSLHLSHDSKTILIGLHSSEIWEITTKDAKFNNATKFSAP